MSYCREKAKLSTFTILILHKTAELLALLYNFNKDVLEFSDECVIMNLTTKKGVLRYGRI